MICARQSKSLKSVQVSGSHCLNADDKMPRAYSPDLNPVWRLAGLQQDSELITMLVLFPGTRYFLELTYGESRIGLDKNAEPPIQVNEASSSDDRILAYRI
ncbi:hypothetical protein L5515_016693 [Caenorhabditis briggsae]|uniref:Uncharacterized protein n=1 Tax=Caenorhabditis briggsae TaxID=6238 RepID=A0AAE9F7H4_CAEBR|nr:hypothetical protein L5515_016693 [Caenorhabditis briggsae]